MKVTVDLSGLDEFVEEVNENATELMKEAAQRAVYMQKERNVSNKKAYQNHTWNLRNAPGAAIVRDGKIVDLYIPADGEHPLAKNRTEAMLIFGSKPKDGVVVADGMEYASFVSSKGFDVLDSASLTLDKELKQSFGNDNVKITWQE
ncbi:hypothetical protein [Bacteroides ovatus]|uniref:hypothetical protein n=1 Tax=Bacteroides ovatus TaxID=28116 RepID=UPI00321B2193